MATTERPFIVCDRCGRVWDTVRADYEPEVCIDCGHDALWAFPTEQAAWEHHSTIADRNAAR